MGKYCRGMTHLKAQVLTPAHFRDTYPARGGGERETHMCFYKRRDKISGVVEYGPVAGSFARSADVSISGIMIYCRARLRGTTALNAPPRLEICV